MISQLIEYGSFDVLDETSIQYYEVVWLTDFGPWLAGTVCYVVSFDFNDGTILEFAEEGHIVRSHGFYAVPRDLSEDELVNLQIPF